MGRRHLTIFLLFVFPMVAVAQYRKEVLPQMPERRFKMPEEHRVAPPPATAAPKESTQNAGFLLLNDAGSAMRLAVNGVGHARVVSAQGYPFSLGWDSSIIFKAQPNKGLMIDARLDMAQRSGGTRYGTGTEIIPNIGVTWMTEIPGSDIYRMITRVGDLRRMTVGKGLFYKDMNEEGVAVQWVGRTQQFGFSYVLEGVVTSSDIVTVDWSNLDRTLGVFASTTIRDDNPGTAIDSRLAGYGRWDMFRWIDIDWEIGLSGTSESDRLGYSVLIAPSKEIKTSSTYFYLGTTFRGYFGSALAPYHLQYFSDVRSSMLDEDLDVDSWRSVMILADSDGTESVYSGSVRLKVEQQLIGTMWGYVDFEGLHVFPEIGSRASINLLNYGVKFALSQHHFGYVGVQEKFLSSTTDVNGSNGSLLVADWAPSVVAGIKFKY